MEIVSVSFNYASMIIILLRTGIQGWKILLERDVLSHFANFQYKTYLDTLNIAKYRKNLSRLRLSSHRLEVEAGRWAKQNKIPYENRKCRRCDVLEDEFHFVMECSMYTDLRRRYINRYYWQRPNMLKFIELLSTEHGKTLKKPQCFY